MKSWYQTKHADDNIQLEPTIEAMKFIDSVLRLIQIRKLSTHCASGGNLERQEPFYIIC